MILLERACNGVNGEVVRRRISRLLVMGIHASSVPVIQDRAPTGDLPREISLATRAVAGSVELLPGQVEVIIANLASPLACFGQTGTGRPRADWPASLTPTPSRDDEVAPA